MDNVEKAEGFLKYIGDNYDRLLLNNKRYADSKLGGFDEDVYQDTIIRIYDKILKDGIEDDSPEGMENYLFKSYKTNVIREQQYSRNRNKDTNFSQDDLMDEYASYYQTHNVTAKEKLIHDIYEDFAVLYILTKVEEAFDAETFFAFRLKTLMGYTYKQLAEKTKIPSVRNKVLDVMDFLRVNVKKDEIKKAFNDNFSDLVDF